ncbi:MAG: YitT family protein [Actinomycetota bacterium]|nr:YitT family protein [Actinomycetota bacterium]
MLPVGSGPDLRRRLVQLLVGLVAAGVGIGLIVRSDLGLGPWDVLHQGLAERTGVPMGMVVIAVGVVVLAAWVPLRQRLGLGTLLNVIVVGTVLDLSLAVLPVVEGLALRAVLLGTGVVAVGLGSGLYLGAGLGPGPRDGLMTALAARGPSVRLVRTGIELSALGAGWLLGGTVGVGTVVFALSIGPLVQLFLARFTRSPAPVPVASGRA